MDFDVKRLAPWTRTILVAILVATASLVGIQTAALAQPPSLGSLELILRMTGVQTQTGALMIELYDAEASYRDHTPPLRQIKVGLPGDPVAHFEGLKPGRYAIKMFHDLHGTGKLTTNLLGMPTEPVGFSNNAKVHGAPPGWTETAFTLDAAHTVQIITIQ